MNLKMCVYFFFEVFVDFKVIYIWIKIFRNLENSSIWEVEELSIERIEVFVFWGDRRLSLVFIKVKEIS